MNNPNQQEEKPQPIFLFISRDCKHCHELIKEIQLKPSLSKKVQGVSIENAPRLPPGLNSVPSLLVNGQLISGNNCFNWVKEQQEEIEAGPSIGAKGGFESDSYSFLNAEDSGGNSAFSFLGAEDGSQGIDHQKANSSDGSKMGDISPQQLQEQRNMEMKQRIR